MSQAKERPILFSGPMVLGRRVQKDRAIISWLIEVLIYGAIGALIGASWMSQHKDVQAAPCVTHHERQLSPHETQPEPTPALAPGRWIDERYQL